MAEVDFTNAVFAPHTNNPNQAIYMCLYDGNPTIGDASQNIIATLSTLQVIQSTPTDLEVVYAGTFTASGTEFYIQQAQGIHWKVSNIRFAVGDTFNFSVHGKFIIV